MSDGTHDTPKLTADIGERVKVTSENGNACTFSVSTEKKALAEEETAGVPDGVANAIAPSNISFNGGRIPFNIPVKWTVDSREHWEYITTDEEFRKRTGIRRYALHKSDSWIYDYELEFDTTDTFFKYRFVDETNDTYTKNDTSIKNALMGGHYSLEYNSDKPTMVFVIGDVR